MSNLLALSLRPDDDMPRVIEAVRQLAAQRPSIGNLTIAETQITSATWASVGSWSLGSALAERRLDLDVFLKVTADADVAEKILPLQLRLLLDSTALDGDWEFGFPYLRMLRPVPTPLGTFIVNFSPATQTIGRGTHTVELQAQVAAGGAWTFLSTSRIRYTMR